MQNLRDPRPRRASGVPWPALVRFRAGMLRLVRFQGMFSKGQVVCWVPSCGCALGFVDEDAVAQQGQGVVAGDQIQVLPAPKPTVRVTHLIFQPGSAS